MTETTRRTALSACLALGMADLWILNRGVFPRLRRLAEASDGPHQREARPMVAVAIEGAPPLLPPAPHLEVPPVVEPATILFPTNVARLGTGARAEVDRLAHQVQGEQVFVVDGHADARGREAYNDRLSRQRALSVAARLLRVGIPSSRIEVHAYGATRPRADGSDPASLQRNRRVEIFLRGGIR